MTTPSGFLVTAEQEEQQEKIKIVAYLSLFDFSLRRPERKILFAGLIEAETYNHVRNVTRQAR